LEHSVESLLHGDSVDAELMKLSHEGRMQFPAFPCFNLSKLWTI